MQKLIATKVRLESILAIQFSRSRLWPNLAILLSLGLWTMLWLSISPGDPKALLSPGSPTAFFHGLRAVFPLIAAGAAVTIIGVKLVQRDTLKFSFFGPLGLAAAYGVVGLAATFNSLNPSTSFWWASLYLSVPVVLWGVAWNGDPLEQLGRLVNLTWIGIILVAMTLFVVAALKLNLIDFLADPARLLECQPLGWFDFTGGRLRETGVGRYAAIAGILAIGGLTHGKWRGMWAAVFLVSFFLLFSTGARGSFGGFGAGAALVIVVYLLSAGKKVLLASIVAAIVLGSALWSTGTLDTFLSNCVFHSTLAPAASVSPANTQEATTPAPAPAIPVIPTDSQGVTPQAETRLISESFFKFSGRVAVWEEGWVRIKSSPLIGYGFHADRLLLGTHMHNSILHSLIQAGFVGAIPFVGAVVFAWFLFFRLVSRLTRLPGSHRYLVVQCGGVLAFLTMRSLPESTGAFFGVDWLILAVVLFYLQVVNYDQKSTEVNGGHQIHERT